MFHFHYLNLCVCVCVDDNTCDVNRYRKSNSWHMLPYNNTVVVHPLDGEIYALIINFSSSYEVNFASFKRKLQIYEL